MISLLRLNAEDNVLVALRAVQAGTVAQGVTVKSDISLAHKVAARDIPLGADVLKYGFVIGRTTRAIAAGEHVHVHNVESKYTATHYNEDESE